MVEPEHPRLSIVRQCELASISRSGMYHRRVGETALNLTRMRLVDAQFLETPWYGSRRWLGICAVKAIALAASGFGG